MAERKIKVVPQKSQVVEKMAALATAAFGLVAALAWNGAIQELFKQIFGEQGGLWAKFTYAILVTIIAVAVIYWIGLFSEKDKDKE